MLFKSTLKNIIDQIDPICEKLCIDKRDRDGLFSIPTGDGGEYLSDGVIVVDVGESYRLNFNDCGELVAVYKQDWDTYGDICYTDISSSVVAEGKVKC